MNCSAYLAILHSLAGHWTALVPQFSRVNLAVTVMQIGLAGKLVAPSWRETVNITCCVLSAIVVLAALVSAIDSFWLAAYRVIRSPEACLLTVKFICLRL